MKPHMGKYELISDKWLSIRATVNKYEYQNMKRKSHLSEQTNDPHTGVTNTREY